MRELNTEILIIGGGTGAIGAALAALRLGRHVIMTEETDWIGGQLTTQAVPPDEHPWIETTGATSSYREWAQRVRAYYKRNYPLTPTAQQVVNLNPGNGYVSRLTHEPRVALAAILEMLAPYQSTGQLRVLLNHIPTAVETDGNRVLAVTVEHLDTGAKSIITAPYILDATELGDLLELANIEYIIGAESQHQTGELHALAGDPQPLDQQAITWCFAMDYFPGENHTIDKPAAYDFWNKYQAEFWYTPQFSWYDVNPITLNKRYLAMLDSERGTDTNGRPLDFWHYRRIVHKDFYSDADTRSDVTLVNWPQIDYWLGPLVGVSESKKAENLRRCKELSLSFLYWMQTEAPRHDGGVGYPGLRLRSDIVGTDDGLAKGVYVRESRRILAEFTVTEQHVGVEQRAGLKGAEQFEDSVGVGSYRIDLHPSTALRTYVDISSYPFQIPLGSLIPQRVENLLPACKNLGVTHITNGCYRLHPVEWNIGEASGALAAYCLQQNLVPRQIRNNKNHLQDFQAMLRNKLGFVLDWAEYARYVAR